MNPNNITTTAAATAAYNKLLAEVLQAGPLRPAGRNIQPAKAVPGSAAAQALAFEAETISDIYFRGISQKRYYSPEAFLTDCGYTWVGTAYAATQTIDDATEASIALALFRRAGLCGGGLRPTTDAAQRSMLERATDFAKRSKPLFAKQAELALA